MRTLRDAGGEFRDRVLLALLLCALSGLAFWNRFVLDDAFISFRYARNLVRGHGLVFNPGEPVEGYTNFLWTLLLAFPHAVGVDPVAFCFAIGPPLLAGTLFATWRAARGLCIPPRAALVVVALVGVNPTFSAFATSGLETQQTALFVTALLAVALRALARQRISPRSALAASLLTSGAVLTRLDAALACAPPLAALALVAWRDPRRTALLARLAVPGAAIGLAWLGWKLHTYGHILPNTWFAKTSGGTGLSQGIRYLGAFLTSYWLWPVPLLCAAALPRVVRAPERGVVVLLCVLVATWLYVVWVGGDFMEFRFLVPTLPAFFLLFGWLAFVWLHGRALRLGLVAMVLAGCVHHATRFTPRREIESIERLASHLHHPANDWVGIGRQLASDVGGPEGPRIATTAAGAIPYESDLPALDMLGLTDPWVARHGIPLGPHPGHSRVAPLRHLVESGVHLVVGHPWLRRASSAGHVYTQTDLERLFVLDASRASLPVGAAVIEVPMGESRRLVLLELAPHPATRRAVATRGWRRFPVEP